jgi:hypothetical protein
MKTRLPCVIHSVSIRFLKDIEEFQVIDVKLELISTPTYIHALALEVGSL